MGIGILQQAMIENARKKLAVVQSTPKPNNIGVNLNTNYTSGGVPKVVQAQPQKPFDVSPLGIVKNTISGLPKATGQVAKDITTSVARIPYSAGEAVGRAVTKNYNPVPASQVPGTSKFLNPIESYQSQASREVQDGSSPLKATAKAVFNVAVDEPLGLAFKPLLSVGALGVRSAAKIGKESKALYKSMTPTERQAGKMNLSAPEPYKGEPDLTTKILRDLEGKTTVSKQYILDATNRGELKQVERDLIRSIAETEGDTVNVPDFAKKVKAELLPLERSYNSSETAYENMTLPGEIRGDIKNYSEHIYNSPIETSAGNVHFGNYPRDVKGYFGHTRVEDMKDGTRRVIEVQSDLYQKGNLERELPLKSKADAQELMDLRKKANASNASEDIVKEFEDRQKEISKLFQYNDPTAHFRMIREEIKKAAQDGKTKLQFPTGETAMKIEGLGQGQAGRWMETIDNGRGGFTERSIEVPDLKVGKEITQDGMDEWIITDVLGDGKFRAVPKGNFDSSAKNFEGMSKVERAEALNSSGFAESFDISGKTDTQNAIYKFYEKDVQKYLNKFGGKKVVDGKGVEWIEVPVKPEYRTAPVEAFGATAGFEQDEEGKLSFDPMKAAFGFAGMTAFNRGKRFFTKAEVDQLRTHLQIAKETLENHPAKKLIKFTNKRTGELPEVLGREVSGIGKKVGTFGRYGDDMADELGFADSETARRAVEDYKKGQARIADMEEQLREARQAVKDEAMSTVKTADQIKKPHLKFDQNGRPLAYDPRERAILQRTDQIHTPKSAVQPVLNQPKPQDALNIESATKHTEGLLGKTQQTGQQSLAQTLRPKHGGVGQSFEEIIQKTPTPVNKKVNLLDYIRTPDRVLKKIGLADEAVLVRRQYDKYLQELPKNIDKVTEWSKRTSKEGNVAIFKYLDGQNIKLPPNEQKIAEEIRVWLSEWADRLKLPKDNRISHYITHIFEPDLIAKEFDEDLAKIIKNKVPGSVYDPFLLERLGAKGYVEDTWRALDAYVKRGTRKVHMDPALEKLKAASKDMEQSQFDYVKKYADRVNMRPTDIDTMVDNMLKSIPGVEYKLGQRPTARITQASRRMVYRGLLGLNASSALRNLSQGANTYAKLGEKYTALGYLHLLKKGTKELEEVGVLHNNFIQDRVINASHKFWEKTDKGLFYLFEKAEKINRGAAYFGAKAQALKRGMSEADAINYAKDIVRDTQFTFGSVDTPVALQSDLVKTFTQLQSFTIKQMEFLGEMAKNKEFLGLTRYALAGLAFVYTIGKLFGMEPDHLIPTFRFGPPPTLQAGWEGIKALTDAPDQYGGDRTTKEKLTDVSKGLLNYIPAAAQAKKTYQGLTAVNEGGSFTKAGNLQYSIPETTENKIRAGLFGKYALPQAREYYDNKEGKLKDKEVEKFEKAETAKSVETRKESYKLYQEIKNLPKGQKAQRFNEIAAQDEEMARKILAHIEDEKLTPQDKQIKALGVESGARAKYLFTQFNKLQTKEEKKALWTSLVDKKILTEQVGEQLIYLINNSQ